MAASTHEEHFSASVVTLPLFRPEANGRQAPQLYGEIVLIRPLALTALLWILLCFFALVVCVLVFGHYTSEAHVTGILLPDRGILKIFPLQAGTLVECHARNGKQVHKGEILFLLSSDRSTAAIRSVGVEAQRQFLSRRQSLVEERVLGEQLGAEQAVNLREHIQRLEEQEEAVAKEIASAGAQLQLDEETVQRYRQLRTQNLISVLELREKESAPLEHQKAFAELKRSQISLEQERRDLQFQLGRLPLQLRVQNAPLERAVSELDSQINEAAANDRAVVRAPADGTLAAVLDHVGMNVDPSTALAALVPAGAHLQAHLYAPSSALRPIKPGQSALLRYDAYPSERYGQQVTNLSEVSQVAISPTEYGGRTGLTAQEPMYEMIAELPSQSLTAFGQSHALWPGMKVESDILLERRSLWTWVLEPILATSTRRAQ